MQLDRAGRLADDHADGLPEADVAVVGSVRIGGCCRPDSGSGRALE